MNEYSSDRYIGTLLGGRYEIVEKIGEGGMAVVYKAMCNRLNRYVAIKIMRDEMAENEEFKRRFCAESQAVAMLSHPNIVTVHDVSQSEDIEYIVMELIDGITLRQYLDKKGPIGWRETLHFSKQIAKALEHAHERCIIHRDIKPQNIMLLRDGTIKVADFGIAALENEAADEAGEAIGSIHYIAPEQARGELPDARGDIYSLGVVMYEMLTGKLPYSGNSISEIAFKHMEGNAEYPHDIVDEIPYELEDIVFKAMNPDVSLRYQSAIELSRALSEFTDRQIESENKQKTTIPELSPITSPLELPDSYSIIRRKRSGKVGFFSGAFLCISVAIVLFVFLWNYWLAELFSTEVSVKVPNFTGQSLEAVINNPEYSGIYNFSVVYVISADAAPGSVVAQDPAVGRMVASTRDGISIKLSVYNADDKTKVPDVVGYSYGQAQSMLMNLGFNVEISSQVSDTIEKDAVISTSPSAGEEASTGATIYIIVSSGQDVSYSQVPLLIGLSEDAAVAKLSSCSLSIGEIIRVPGTVDPGIVVAQSIEAFTEVQEHTKINLSVSTGVG